MTKSELIDAMATRSDLTKARAELVVNCVFDAMTEALLAVENLNVSYGPSQALFDLSLEVTAGSVTAILGANGAGKSTLARTVSGLVPAASGRVTFDGVVLGNLATPLAIFGLGRTARNRT